jgi:hypothetical protein
MPTANKTLSKTLLLILFDNHPSWFHHSRQQAEIAVFRQMKAYSLEKLFGVVRVTVIGFSFGAFSDLHVSAFK